MGRTRPRSITATGKPGPWGRCRDLAWSPDGRVLFFDSDATGVSGIYAATVALAREDLTSEDLPERAPEPKERAKEPEPAPGGAPDPNQPAAKPKEPERDAAQPEPAKPDDAKPAPKADQKKVDEKKPKKPDWGKRWAEAVTSKGSPVLGSGKEHRKPLPSPEAQRLL